MEETLLNAFYKGSVTPIPTPDKNRTKIEKHRTISMINIDTKKILSNERRNLKNTHVSRVAKSIL